ncbi:MAG: helicase-related protein [bacterium]
MHALVAWIRRHQCPAVAIGGAADASAADRRWSDRRLIIFTEYADTLGWLHRQLSAHLEGTDQADARVMRFHGGMADDARTDVKRAFNDPAHPVRILLATDAAREGINLQGACADLLHIDIPWNPARLEQRNGRIDRTLQPEPEVRCAYFVYPQRPADAVLDTLVRKVATIRKELGSVGTVTLERIEQTLAAGIDADTAARLEAATAAPPGRQAILDELETQRARARLQQDTDAARATYDRSAEIIAFEPDALRHVVDQGLRLLGAAGLAPTTVDDGGTAIDAWTLPPLPADWDATLDTLRPERPRDVPPWEWRRRFPPLPVVFKPTARLTTHAVHLHLEHPLVRRLLARFRAQGFAAHDLRRVAVLGLTGQRTPLVVAIGRVSLFGPGASRLHDELIYVGTPWREAGGPEAPAPNDTKTRTLIERVLREPPRPVSPDPGRRLAAHAAADFRFLWPHVEAEAEARAHDARQLLDARAHAEQQALHAILVAQRQHLERETQQTSFDFGDLPKDAARQRQDDVRHMEQRLRALETEIVTEPAALADLYAVRQARVEPVGLVYLWPVGA